MNNAQLIESLIIKGVLKSTKLIEAFDYVDRADFVPDELYSVAYDDRPLPIGSDQTISQPYTVAFMFELLQPGPNDRIMDLGSGSGWTTALLASVCKHVDAVERQENLIELSTKNLSKYPFANISLHRARKSLGLKGKLFDKILVSCAAEEIPQSLVQQLSPGGIMVIPIKNSIMKVTKTLSKSLEIDEYPGFVFVPLIVD